MSYAERVLPDDTAPLKKPEPTVMTITNPVPAMKADSGAGTGARTVAPPVRTGLIRLRVRTDDARRRELNDQEIEVLSLIASGGTKDSISRDLGVSPSTVSSCVARIYRALGAHNAPHAVALAHAYRVLSARPLPPAPSVSRRERQVLAGLAYGLTTEQVATHLSLSGDTVKTHLRHAYRKLRANCRADAVDAAISLRLLAVVVDPGVPAGARDPAGIAGAALR